MTALASMFGQSGGAGRNYGAEGLSVAQLQKLTHSLPPLHGRIQAFRLFRDDSPSVNAAAILTAGKKSGWQLFVFRAQPDGKAALKWKSGKLANSFAVSSGDEFQIPELVGQQVLSFSGCSAHACPDVFSALIYVPSLNTAFSETYLRGTITYSPPNFARHGYAAFKEYLDRQVAKRLKAAR